MAGEDKNTETLVTVAYELHDRPGMWGWDLSGRNL